MRLGYFRLHTSHVRNTGLLIKFGWLLKLDLKKISSFSHIFILLPVFQQTGAQVSHYSSNLIKHFLFRFSMNCHSCAMLYVLLVFGSRNLLREKSLLYQMITVMEVFSSVHVEIRLLQTRRNARPNCWFCYQMSVSFLVLRAPTCLPGLAL